MKKKAPKEPIVITNESQLNTLVIFMSNQIYELEQEIANKRKAILRYEKNIRMIKETKQYFNTENQSGRKCKFCGVPNLYADSRCSECGEIL